MTIEEKLEKLADSQMVTNAMVVRLENGINSLTERVDSLTVAVARFMERADDAITKLAAAQLVTEEKLHVMDDAITRLAAAQLVTEEKLQGLIDALKRGGNGTR